jgi:AbiTii
VSCSWSPAISTFAPRRAAWATSSRSGTDIIDASSIQQTAWPNVADATIAAPAGQVAEKRRAVLRRVHARGGEHVGRGLRGGDAHHLAHPRCAPRAAGVRQHLRLAAASRTGHHLDLIAQLERDIPDRTVLLSDRLLTCAVLAGQIRAPQLEEWANAELSSYPGADVPEYRRIAAPMMQVIEGMHGGQIKQPFDCGPSEPDLRVSVHPAQASPAGSRTGRSAPCQRRSARQVSITAANRGWP